MNLDTREPIPETQITESPAVDEGPSDEQAFLDLVSDTMQHDPASAIEALAKRFTDLAAREAEDAVRRVLAEQRRMKTHMDEFFEDPGNAAVKPYREEAEHLMLERGMSPGEATDLIRAVERKHLAAVRDKSDASRSIRRLAALESPEGRSSRARGDGEFNRTIKKAKTLEEMFAGLRKLGRG